MTSEDVDAIPPEMFHPDCPECEECREANYPETGECGRCGEENGKGGSPLWNDLCEDCDRHESGNGLEDVMNAVTAILTAVKEGRMTAEEGESAYRALLPTAR